MKHARPVLIALALSLAAFVVGPAGAADGAAAPAKLDPKSPEGRAVARWEYIIQGKPEKAYDLLSPGARSAKPRAVWAKEIAERPVRWEKVQFRDKACDSEEACSVRLEITYTAPLQGAPGGMLSSPGFLTEHWIKVKKQWYFVPDDYVAGGLR
jgi:hypothetical protein